MLKKNNKILVGCLALLLVMAVGYALFSETITINGTATAKGEFDITATCNSGLNPTTENITDYITNTLKLGPEGGYKNDSCTVEGNNVTFNVEFEYPGARRYFVVKLTNNGTITSSFPEAETDWEICNDTNLNNNFESSECKSPSGSSVIDILMLEKSNGQKVDFLEASDEDLAYFKNSEDEYILPPGASIYAYYTFAVEDSVGSNAGGEFNYKLTSTDTFNFTQVTN